MTHPRPVTVEIKPRKAGGVIARTPAKVNLVLSVGERRPDGYHDIDSLFVAIDLTDEIELIPGAQEPGLELEGRPIPGDGASPRGNLCWRALLSYCERAGIRPAHHLRLAKRIPVGAGLGGGSGNAAGVLLGLEALAAAEDREPIGERALREIAATLGSDVPFFLGGGAARCRGRGELVEPWKAGLCLQGVILFPGVSICTAEVYSQHEKLQQAGVDRGILPVTREGTVVWVGKGSPRAGSSPRAGRGSETARIAPSPLGRPATLDPGSTPPRIRCGVFALEDSGPAWDSRDAVVQILCSNDLEQPATMICPLLLEVRECLDTMLGSLGRAAGARPMICGSGSSYFVPLPDGVEPDLLLERVVALGIGEAFPVRSFR